MFVGSLSFTSGLSYFLTSHTQIRSGIKLQTVEDMNHIFRFYSLSIRISVWTNGNHVEIFASLILEKYRNVTVRMKHLILYVYSYVKKWKSKLKIRVLNWYSITKHKIATSEELTSLIYFNVYVEKETRLHISHLF